MIMVTNLNESKSNITKKEADALTTLLQLQKNSIIVIKPCDKEAGTIICDFEKYNKSCLDHLDVC